MSYELETIPEYVFLSIADADQENYGIGIYEWTLPTAHFTNKRGSICYVSLADANIGIDNDTNIAIRYNGGKNFRCSNNSVDALIGFCISNTKATDGFGYNKTESIKLLVTPTNKIRLSFYKTDCTPLDIDDGIFALKYEYVNPIDSTREFQKTYYKTI